MSRQHPKAIKKKISKSAASKAPKTKGRKPKAVSSVIKVNARSLNRIDRLYGVGKKIAKIPAVIVTHIRGLPRRTVNAYKAYKEKKAYKTLHLQKRLRSVRRPLPSSWMYFKDSWRFLVKNWRTMSVLILLYAVIYIIFLAPQHSLSTTDIQDAITKAVGDRTGAQAHLFKAGSTIGITLLDSGQSSAAGVIIGFCMSLIFIWAIRHLSNKRKIKARDAIYQGPAPIVSFVLILLIIAIECIPALFASFLYASAKNTGLLTTGFENFIFFAALALVILLCLYWATSAVIALYIVTLPGMYPMRALRSARDLIVFRRFEVFRKIVALPIILLVLFSLVLLGVVLTKPDLLVLTLNLITIITMPLFHTYLYKVYRSLI